MINFWIVVDTQTGAINGFFMNKKDAAGAYDRAVDRGARSLVLCQIAESCEGTRISDSVFWTTHPQGFAGDAQNNEQ